MFSHSSKKKWNTVEWKTNKERIIENKNYISRNKRPPWCKKFNKKFIPRYRCLACKCPFFAYADADIKDYKIFDKAYDKSPEKEISSKNQ